MNNADYLVDQLNTQLRPIDEECFTDGRTRTIVTEDDKEVIDSWYDMAEKCKTPAEAYSFIHYVMDDFHHDYGTVCHAIAASGIAAMWAAEHMPRGGITGFQAGFVGMLAYTHWCRTNNKCGVSFIDYDEMLYPQNKDRFTKKEINSNTWEALRKEARSRLDKYTPEEVEEAISIGDPMICHWLSIDHGVVPFGYSLKK